MPYYEVHHSLPLSDAQRQELAQAITTVHVTAFNTPSMFVIVRFVAEDLAQGNVFVAGVREDKTSNSIISYVRTSPARTKADFDKVAQELEDAWYKIVGNGQKTSAHPYLSEKPEARLHAIGMLPIVTAREAGFGIPVAGEESEWIQEHLPVFKELAGHGETSFVSLLAELQSKSAKADV
ncbi:Tautomerase [Cordyceps javanica]|uniref:Tautomerase n=1 Tax=Cordyceps javanica TaxID=43265 RepID=A0A545UPY4_9HYPO|nr:Tautomerase [Cordyceps javanica]TQW03692.1 Tautomerase [Cordyceps javanica]